MQDFYEHPHYDVENIANDVSLVKNNLLIRIPKTSILRRCDFPRALFPTHRTFVQPVCLLGWLKTSTPRSSSYKLNLLIIVIIS